MKKSQNTMKMIVASISTALFMTISAIVLEITVAFGRGGDLDGSESSQPKNEVGFEKMVKQASRCSQRTC